MSEKILASQEGVITLMLIFLIAGAIWLVVSIISWAITYYCNKKKAAFEEKEEQENAEYRKRKSELANSPAASLSQEIDDKLYELQMQHQEEADEIKEQLDKYKKREEAVDNIASTLKAIFGGIFGFAFWLFLIFAIDLGGSVGTLRTIEDNGNDVRATAYMVVDYDYVDQDTLTVFVKNESKQTVQQAVVEEVNTGKSAVIESIEPGQEKIVSIDVYPTYEEEYKFELKDIQFK